MGGKWTAQHAANRLWNPDIGHTPNSRGKEAVAQKFFSADTQEIRAWVRRTASRQTNTSVRE